MCRLQTNNKHICKQHHQQHHQQLKQKHFQFKYDTNKSLLFFTLCVVSFVFFPCCWWCLFCKEFPWKIRETKDAQFSWEWSSYWNFLVSLKFPDACVLDVVAKINNEIISRNALFKKYVWCCCLLLLQLLLFGEYLMNIIQSTENGGGRQANGVHLENCVIEFPWLTFTIKYHISGAVVANKLNGIWSESHITYINTYPKVYIYMNFQFPRYQFQGIFPELYFSFFYDVYLFLFQLEAYVVVE